MLQADLTEGSEPLRQQLLGRVDRWLRRQVLERLRKVDRCDFTDVMNYISHLGPGSTIWFVPWATATIEEAGAVSVSGPGEVRVDDS